MKKLMIAVLLALTSPAFADDPRPMPPGLRQHFGNRPAPQAPPPAPVVCQLPAVMPAPGQLPICPSGFVEATINATSSGLTVALAVCCPVQ